MKSWILRHSSTCDHHTLSFFPHDTTTFFSVTSTLDLSSSPSATLDLSSIGNVPEMVDPPTLKRRKSLSSGLSSLALTPIHPPAPPPPTPIEDVPKERPYSFLAVVLEGFANEPVAPWEERGEVSLPFFFLLRIES